MFGRRKNMFGRRKKMFGRGMDNVRACQENARKNPKDMFGCRKKCSDRARKCSDMGMEKVVIYDGPSSLFYEAPPMSDVPRVAMHINRMRQQQSRLRALAQPRIRQFPVSGVYGGQQYEE